MRRVRYSLIPLALVAILASCGGRQADGPVPVSVIGESPSLIDPNEKPLPAPAAVLLSATAQGLVRFDAAGQIEPGLAMRWAVSDDGLYYTFRLRGQRGIDAEDVARRLRAALGRNSRNPLKPQLAGIDEIVAVTPEVVEVRLAAPRPNLLELLAQPELAILHRKSGGGPFDVDGEEQSALVLRPIVEDGQELDAEEQRRREVRLRGERAALAVTRFAEGSAALVLGGTFDNLALARVARLPARSLRFDPVAGLFGLAVVGKNKFLASADNRRALAMSIDRDRIAATFANANWSSTDALVAPGTAELGAAIPPDWGPLPPALRGQIAAGTVQFWARRNGTPPRLRIALPAGPGGRLLFAVLASGWKRIGLDAEQVAPGAEADLRLIDAVAPSDTASWYLEHFTCQSGGPCSSDADAALEAAQRAATANERAARLGEARTALAAITPFLPIAQPLRWSLVAPRLDGVQENGRGVHPLNHLRRSQ